MSENAEQVHGALLESFRLFMAMLPDGWMADREGYRVLSAPSFPIPSANAVWADDPDEEAAVRELATTLAELGGRGVSPAVVVLEGLTPGVEAEARRLGFTGVERISGMLATPDSFRPPDGSGPELVRVGTDENLLRVALDLTARDSGRRRRCSGRCSNT